MFFYEGFTCPICHTPFQKDDDIVSCPHCGLPHHRACWKQEGRCHLEHLHGTDEQWTRVDAQPSYANDVQSSQPEESASIHKEERVCPRCHTKNPQFAEICTHCGQALPTEEWHSEPQQTPPGAAYSPFRSPFSYQNTAYSQTERIGNHTAAEWEAMVGNNAAYYLPRFRQIETGCSGGWNWCAFLFAPYWLLYRKQYFLGLLYFFCQTIYSFAYNYVFFPMQSASTMTEMQEEFQKILFDENMRVFLLPIFLLSVILLVAKILLGIKGTELYKRHCEQRIQNVRKRTPDLSTAELASFGGTSMSLAVIFYLIPTVISYVLALLNIV